MARKKIVFVIVEGPSDSDALGLYFNRFFDRNSHILVPKQSNFPLLL